MFDTHEPPETLPPAVIGALRAPATGGHASAARRDASVAAIMAAVRDAPAPRRAAGHSRRLSLRPMRPRWALRRGMFSPAAAVLAAGLTLVVGWIGALGSPRAGETPIGAGTRVPVAAVAFGGAGALRDSLLGNALVLAIRDTLRVVRFALEAPSASQVALVGDFTGWGAAAIPLRRDRGAWTADVPLRGGRHRFGFVVDGSRWIGSDRAGSAVSGPTESIAIAPARAVGDTI